MQQKGMMKLMGSDYTIVYRKGKENKVADALSRLGWGEAQNMAVTTITLAWTYELERTVIMMIHTPRQSLRSLSYSLKAVHLIPITKES